MKYISRILINKLISSVNIIDIISSKINLKKFGKYYKSFCPFHNEKVPSFIVNEDKQFFYCFGCKCYGNIIDFLIKINNYNFLDAIKELSNISNISIKYKNIDINYKYNFNKKIFFNLMFNFNRIYVKSLFLNLNRIKNFFIKRKINYSSIYNFSIGFSCKKLINKFIYNLNINNRKFLFKLGILIKNKYGIFCDRLYNRIIFPIYNLNGNIVAFGGRSINENNFYKYINSSNNMFFCKRNYLYNFFNIIKDKNKLKKILIVEGYIDVIMLSKFGINYSVALLGSNICKKQIEMLYLYTNKIIFCLDGDKSNFLSIKNIIILLISYINENRISFFIFLPNKEDPDSLINKEGKILFKNRINNALSIFDVLFKFFILGKNLYTYHGQISFVSSLLPIISKINCPIIRSFLKQKISNKIGILNDNYLDKFLLLNNDYKPKKIKFTIIRCLISLLLKYPYLSYNINLCDKLFNNNNDIPGLYLFLNIVNLCISNKNISIKNILYYYNDNVKNYLIKLFLWNYFPKNINYNIIFNDALIKLKIFIIEFKIKKMLNNNNLYELSLNKKLEIWKLIKLKNFFFN